MEKSTQKWTQSRPFFPKSGHFCRFSKSAGLTSPLSPSCALVSVAEYASISANMPKYSWKCLNKLFWLCQGSEYAWSSYMLDRLLKMPWVLNKPVFWIFSLNLYQVLSRFLIISTVRHVLYDDSPLIQSKGYILTLKRNFSLKCIKCFKVMWPEVGMATLGR